MGKGVEVPITGAVLSWALSESGYSAQEVAAACDVSVQDLEDWQHEVKRPLIGQMKALAQVLHRQFATFLLPKPPQVQMPSVAFRAPLAQKKRKLNPVESRYVRRAARLQRAQSWIAKELGVPAATMPGFDVNDDHVAAAAKFRKWLGVPLEDQLSWKSASVAFDSWRAALETRGISVVQYSMGEDSCRGFSLWDKSAPLVAVNTKWRDEARIFSVFHEIGHLATKTNSACSMAPITTSQFGDALERWCEGFAAAVLIPPDSLVDAPYTTSLAGLTRLASKYRVSVRAMALSLIGSGKATWDLYRTIPPAADAKKQGGGGGGGRDRTEIRNDEVGRHSIDLFVKAVKRDLISTSQAIDHLDVPVGEFDRWVNAGS